jgi:hypothetical protein
MLVRGSWLPLVFRKKEANWELIGHAYVLGLMQGEQWEESKCQTISIG